MSNSDPLADMITRIRNGQRAGKGEIWMSSSKLKVSVCKVLKDEGYIIDYNAEPFGATPKLRLSLKYHKGIPVITNLQRVSKVGRRVYKTRENLPVVLGGLGVAIISTSKGIMSDSQARAAGYGGEVLCTVS